MNQKLTQLTEHIWLWPHNPSYQAVQSCVGIIHCQTETVLVDAGNGPLLADRVHTILKQSGFPPVSHIIYTHHHWDHTFGACEFQVPVVAHELTKAILTEEKSKPWSEEYLHQQIKINPKLRVSYSALERAVQNWDAFRIVIPDIVFDHSLSLRCGGIDLELEHVGGKHAEDSIVVKAPQERVLFLGDCYYPPPLHLQTSKPETSLSMLGALESEDYTHYVGGHSKPMTRTELLKRI